MTADAPIETTGWRHGKPTPVTLWPIGGAHYLDRPAALAFLAMSDAAKADGVEFEVNSAFRSNVKQEQLYAEYEAALRMGKPHPIVAPPRWSNHQSGVAVDIACMGAHANTFAWLTRRAHEFGFKRTVPTEVWHWEYREPAA